MHYLDCNNPYHSCSPNITFALIFPFPAKMGLSKMEKGKLLKVFHNSRKKRNACFSMEVKNNPCLKQKVCIKREVSRVLEGDLCAQKRLV